MWSTVDCVDSGEDSADCGICNVLLPPVVELQL